MKKTNLIFMTTAIMAVSAMTSPMSVFADSSVQSFNYNATDQTSSNVTVSYENEPLYTVTIPADVSFDENLADKTNDVVVEDVYLNKGKAVKVTVSSANNYKMLLDGTDTATYIPYTLTSDKATIDEVVTVNSGTKSHPATETAKLTYSVTDKDVPNAGSYSDILTFTIAVVDAT